MLIYVWRSEKQRAHEAMRQDHEAAQLEDKIAAEMRKTRNQAIGKLKVAFARITRGEIGMRVFVWRSGARAAKDAALAAMSNKLAARMKAQGLTKLKDTISRIMRGHMGMLIYVWRSQMKQQKQQQRQVVAAREVARGLHRLREQAVMKLVVTFRRLVRGDLALLVYVWRTNQLKATHEGQIMKSVLMHLDFIGYGTTLGTTAL